MLALNNNVNQRQVTNSWVLEFSRKDALCWDCFFCQSLFCINWIIADSIFSQCIAKLLWHSTTHSSSRTFWDTRWTGTFYISFDTVVLWCLNWTTFQILEFRHKRRLTEGLCIMQILGVQTNHVKQNLRGWLASKWMVCVKMDGLFRILKKTSFHLLALSIWIWT